MFAFDPNDVLIAAEILAIAAFSLFVYFLPYIVASRRSHPNAAAIGILNLFLGWTFLGWVIALVWASTAVHNAANLMPSPITQKPVPYTPPNQAAVARPRKSAKILRKTVRIGIAVVGEGVGRCWRQASVLPVKIDGAIHKAAGQDNDIIYRFLQVLLYVVVPIFCAAIIVGWWIQ